MTRPARPLDELPAIEHLDAAEQLDAQARPRRRHRRTWRTRLLDRALRALERAWRALTTGRGAHARLLWDDRPDWVPDYQLHARATQLAEQAMREAGGQIDARDDRPDWFLSDCEDPWHEQIDVPCEPCPTCGYWSDLYEVPPP